MNFLKQWIIRKLSQRARRYFKSYGLFQTVKHTPAFVWEPGGGKILILAPHMDDEVIGCGGTLYKHILNGADVTVVYITDGRTGSSVVQESFGKEREIREKELVELRKQEASLALKTLGINEGIFLDADDGGLTSTAEISDRLREILAVNNPDLVYLPFFLEEHPDHRVTSQILLDATEGYDFEFDCYGYEVWTTLFPNCYVDISDVVELKKQALRHYRSQLADKDYIHSSLGLNAYRYNALLDNRGGFAEAFYMSSLKEYRKLYNSHCKLDFKS